MAALGDIQWACQEGHGARPLWNAEGCSTWLQHRLLAAVLTRVNTPLVFPLAGWHLSPSLALYLVPKQHLQVCSAANLESLAPNLLFHFLSENAGSGCDILGLARLPKLSATDFPPL